MPPQIGLFFVLMKPQIGFSIALLWLYQAWKQGGFRQVLLTFGPVTVAYLISFLLHGFWIVHLFGMPHNPYNESIFPFALPMGVVLLYISLKELDLKLSAFTSPLFTPYCTNHNYSIMQLGLFNRPKLFIMAWIVFWITAVLRFL